MAAGSRRRIASCTIRTAIAIRAPYFFDTDVDVPVDCMPSCTTPANPPRYEPVTYGAVLERHLVSNYTYRKEGI